MTFAAPALPEARFYRSLFARVAATAVNSEEPKKLPFFLDRPEMA
jgi:hypothetical protein